MTKGNTESADSTSAISFALLQLSPHSHNLAARLFPLTMTIILQKNENVKTNLTNNEGKFNCFYRVFDFYVNCYKQVHITRYIDRRVKVQQLSLHALFL